MTSFSKVSPVQDLLDELHHTDDFDLSLMVAVIGVAHSELAHLSKLNLQLLEAVRKEKKNQAHYKKQSNNKRKRQANLSNDKSPVWGEDIVNADAWGEDIGGDTRTKFASWKEISDSVSDRVFRRKFRMTKAQFKLLCRKIRNTIGEEKFRSTNSQAVCGFMKVAIGLRILCGDSYLDLDGRAYDVSGTSSVYRYFHSFIDWIDETFDFP